MLNLAFGFTKSVCKSSYRYIKFAVIEPKKWLVLQIPTLPVGIVAYMKIKLPAYLYAQNEISNVNDMRIALAVTISLVTGCIVTNVYYSTIYKDSDESKADSVSKCEVDERGSNSQGKLLDNEKSLQEFIPETHTEREIVEMFDDNGNPFRVTKEKVVKYG